MEPMGVTVKVMKSNHHVHLSEEMVKKLVGEKGITRRNFLLGDQGPYACEETLTVAGPKGSISNVRVLGPCRGYNQVELLTADTYKLGVKAPIRLSGNLEGATVLKLIGPCGEAELPCGIIAHRHIHLMKDFAEKHGFQNGEIVQVKIKGIRGGLMDNVSLHVCPGGTVMHVDIEEANAFGLRDGDNVEIIKA